MVAESLPEGSKIILAKCNCSGTKIGIIFNQVRGGGGGGGMYMYVCMCLCILLLLKAK